MRNRHYVQKRGGANTRHLASATSFIVEYIDLHLEVRLEIYNRVL